MQTQWVRAGEAPRSPRSARRSVVTALLVTGLALSVLGLYTQTTVSEPTRSVRVQPEPVRPIARVSHAHEAGRQIRLRARVASIPDSVPNEVLSQLMADPPDVIVVLGARVRAGRPGRHLYRRMRTALRLYHALGNQPMLLLTGGRGEAVAMRDYLLAYGVPEEQLILETRSQNTQQNARYSMQLLERQSPRFQSALLVTTAVAHRRRIDDHARRALAQFRVYARTVRITAINVNWDLGLIPAVYGRSQRSHHPNRRSVHPRDAS
jgi:uncharacterized SAM-binding protein YcdF (DUF218 family)